MTQPEIEEIQVRYGKGPSFAADVAVVTARFVRDEVDLRLLLIERGNKPFQGLWALPGGFVELAEDLEPAARRELREETGIQDLGDIPLEQVGAFGNPTRDPRARVISVVYLAWVREDLLPTPHGEDDAADAAFVRLRDGVAVDEHEMPLPLAFDHDQVLLALWKRMQQQSVTSSIPLRVLPDPFSTEQLVAFYEALHGPTDRDALVSWMQASGWIRSVGAGWSMASVPQEKSLPWNRPPISGLCPRCLNAHHAAHRI